MGNSDSSVHVDEDYTLAWWMEAIGLPHDPSSIPQSAHAQPVEMMRFGHGSGPSADIASVYPHQTNTEVPIGTRPPPPGQWSTLGPSPAQHQHPSTGRVNSVTTYVSTPVASLRVFPPPSAPAPNQQHSIPSSLSALSSSTRVFDYAQAVQQHPVVVTGSNTVPGPVGSIAFPGDPRDMGWPSAHGTPPITRSGTSSRNISQSSRDNHAQVHFANSAKDELHTVLSAIVENPSQTPKERQCDGAGSPMNVDQVLSTGRRPGSPAGHDLLRDARRSGGRSSGPSTPSPGGSVEPRNHMDDTPQDPLQRECANQLSRMVLDGPQSPRPLALRGLPDATRASTEFIPPPFTPIAQHPSIFDGLGTNEDAVDLLTPLLIPPTTAPPTSPYNNVYATVPPVNLHDLAGRISREVPDPERSDIDSPVHTLTSPASSWSGDLCPEASKYREWNSSLAPGERTTSAAGQFVQSAPLAASTSQRLGTASHHAASRPGMQTSSPPVAHNLPRYQPSSSAMMSSSLASPQLQPTMSYYPNEAVASAFVVGTPYQQIMPTPMPGTLLPTNPIIPQAPGDTPAITYQTMRIGSPLHGLYAYRGAQRFAICIDLEWDDADLFRELKQTYDRLRGWRKWCSLKSVKSIAPVVDDHRFVYPQRIGPAKVSTRQQMRFRFLFDHPECLRGKRTFMKTLVERPGVGIEFVERWQAKRFTLAILVPVFLSLVAVTTYAATTRDVSTAFTIGGYLTSAFSVILVLIGVLNFVDL